MLPTPLLLDRIRNTSLLASLLNDVHGMNSDEFVSYWQSLVRVLESGAGATHCYSLILFQDLLVSTTLSPVWFYLQGPFDLSSFLSYTTCCYLYSLNLIGL